MGMSHEMANRIAVLSDLQRECPLSYPLLTCISVRDQRHLVGSLSRAPPNRS